MVKCGLKVSKDLDSHSLLSRESLVKKKPLLLP